MKACSKKEGFVKKNSEDIYSNAVRAGKRTYFFDAKITKNDDYYLTITESKRRYNKKGELSFEKHKIFLYKEDFDKFSQGLLESIEVLKQTNQSSPEESSEIINGLEVQSFSQLEFEDLSE